MGIFEGTMRFLGQYGDYWSQTSSYLVTITNSYSYELTIDEMDVNAGHDGSRGYGFSLRCLAD